MYQCGMERLLADRVDLVTGRRVALLAHPASLCEDGRHSANRLRECIGSGLRGLMGPEHGFQGQVAAGEPVAHERHPQWDIPVWSLYGADTAWPAMAAEIDTVIFDLQDLGVRCYTYLHTLFELLRAAQTHGWQVIVTDRAVPWAPTVDGPVADEHYKHTICPGSVPFVYGMTPGEATRWYVQQCDGPLDWHVVPAAGYRRGMDPSTIWPQWVPPSPAIRSLTCAHGFPIMVFTEACRQFECARTTANAFTVCQAANVNIPAIVDRLKAYALSGIEFQRVPGVDTQLRLQIADPARCRPIAAAITLLYELHQELPGGLFAENGPTNIRWFDLLMGTDQVRLLLQQGATPAEIIASWQEPLTSFEAERKDALLYDDAD